MDDSERPFIIERPNSSPEKLDGKIILYDGAKHWAREHNMTQEEMAAYLLRQRDRRESGLEQKVGEN
jgi:hypothetical protein